MCKVCTQPAAPETTSQLVLASEQGQATLSSTTSPRHSTQNRQTFARGPVLPAVLTHPPPLCTHTWVHIQSGAGLGTHLALPHFRPG